MTLRTFGRALSCASTLASLKASQSEEVDLSYDDRFEPIPPDEQQLPTHRVHPREEAALPWHLRD